MTVRVIFHRSEGVQPLGVDEALSAEGYAEFYDGPLEASRLAFTLSKAGPAVLIHNDVGRHVGTFADPALAIAHGFSLPHRARRRTTKASAPR